MDSCIFALCQSLSFTLFMVYRTDVLSKVTVCSHSCRMGGLHSWWQPGEVKLTVLESCSPQEPWWTWLTRWVSDTMSIGNMLDITRGRAAASGYSSRLVCLFVCDTVYSPGFHSTVFTAWIAFTQVISFQILMLKLRKLGLTRLASYTWSLFDVRIYSSDPVPGTRYDCGCCFFTYPSPRTYF